MSQFVSRGNGLFFENKLTPQEKQEAEYRRRVRDLEARVDLLEDKLETLLLILENKEA